MRKYVLKALVLLVAFMFLSMVMPSVSAGDDPQGKPFQALSNRIDDLESRSNDWDTAYGWGDHSAMGYLTSYTETDPVFSASPAAGITSAKISNWDTAYGWGDHSTEGYLTSYTETDPVYSASPAAGITAAKITNWDTTFGWGDHSTAGYLTSYTETDPVFGVSPASSITSTQINDWDTAYSWGDHASAGYDTTDDSWIGTTDLYTTSGNVGIGIISPVGPLHVAGKEEQTDQQQTQYTSGYTSPLWQSFTPGITGTLTRLDVRNVNLATPTSGTLKIYSGEGTSGTLLYTMSFSFSSGYGWKPLEMSDGPELTSGQKYTIKIEGGSRLGKRAADVYAGGQASWSASEDLMFVTYMTTPKTGLLVTSDGKVGIGTTNPTSLLQIDGLPAYSSNAAAIAAGHTKGALYRNGDNVCIVH